MEPLERVVVLGCGYAGTAVARLARGRGMSVLAHVRSDARAASLRAEGLDVLQLPSLDAAALAAHVDGRSLVVIAYPPDAETDQRVAPLLSRAGAAAYVSSTGVYGEHRGIVDDATVVPPPNARSARRLAAEDTHRTHGATIFRCPALYGRDRGLHVRVIRGEHSIPGDGMRYISRIHVADLAQLVLALASPHARDRSLPSVAGECFVVGDDEPAPHLDVVRFICDAYGVPLPPFVPLESVDESLRADRRVDASRARSRFQVELEYRSYRDGMAPAATGLCAPANEAGTPTGMSYGR